MVGGGGTLDVEGHLVQLLDLGLFDILWTDSLVSSTGLPKCSNLSSDSLVGWRVSALD